MSTRSVLSAELASLTSPSADNRERDEAALHALLRGLADSWNCGDSAGWRRFFTPDSDFIAFNGMHLKGAKANEDSHRALFASVLRGSELVFEGDPSIRFLSPPLQ